MQLLAKQFVYVFRDRFNNNHIKVGFSKEPLARLSQLYRTNTPAPMEPYCIWRVSDMRLAERATHAVLHDHRINGRREFFEIAPTPDFSVAEQTDYDLSCTFLDHLLEIMEEAMDSVGVVYQRMVDVAEIRAVIAS